MAGSEVITSLRGFIPARVRAQVQGTQSPVVRPETPVRWERLWPLPCRLGTATAAFVHPLLDGSADC